jgi:histidinol-phosphate aminotransferase
MEAYIAEARKLHRYPSTDHTALREALGKKNGLDPERIIVTGGSDQLLELVCRAYAGPGDEVLYGRHGFSMYAIFARGVGAKPVQAPETDLTIDVDAMLKAVTPATRVILIANPSNPTGTYVNAAELRRLHRALRPGIALVLDGAYAEFTDAADYEAGAALAMDAANVLMTRTFSKIYGLGGLRIGWGYGSAGMIDTLNRIRGPFNVSTPGLAAALAALDDAEFVAKAHDHNTRWRAWLTEEIRALGLRVPPSQANFVLIQFPDEPGLSAAAADRFITERGYILRRLGAYGLPNCLRLTVGLEEHNRAVVALLAEYVAANRRANAPR